MLWYGAPLFANKMPIILSSFCLWTIFTCFAAPSNGQVLTPPYFNLAVGRRITASATCGVGVSENELYCKLVGANTDKQDNPNINLIQGQVCDYCRGPAGIVGDPEMMHPPEFAIDGTERWWQSPPLSRGTQYNNVNLTVDLGQVCQRFINLHFMFILDDELSIRSCSVAHGFISLDFFFVEHPQNVKRSVSESF